MAIPALQDVATSAAPEEQRASVMAAWVSSVRLGQTAGPLLFAAVYGLASTSVAMVVGAALFGLVTVFFAVGPLDDAGVEATGR